MSIQSYLQNHVLLFDGAMGTYFAARNGRQAESCETANLTAPEAVLEIHREYIRAGAKAIKTNTFGANRKTFPSGACGRIIDAGWKLAEEAGAAFVFADIGPIKVTDDDDLWSEYRFVTDRFLQLGAKNFLFETNSEPGVLGELAAYIKEKCPDSFVMISFAAMPDGFTRSGLLARDLLASMAANPAVDGVGLNCLSSARHMVDLAESLTHTGKAVSMMPNAGYPEVRGGRSVYAGSPDYFARQMVRLAAHGAKILGGCCGTTPEHIAAVNRLLSEGAGSSEPASAKAAAPEKRGAVSPFLEALCDPNQKPFAVELDPPEAADVAGFMEGARELKESGASVITIADCAIGRARMDSSLLACRIHRELNMETLPHMTCRDRNLIATKALLLGLCAEEVHNVLIVTGDPIPTESRDEVKSVYNFNSRMLANYVRSLGETVLPVPFRVFGALNVNAPNFDIQLKLAKEKEENGICGFLTQPVLTEQGFENLKRAKETLRGRLLGGMMPIVSQRNALFMDNEVTGISVDPKIIDLYEGADREKGEALAVRITAEIAKKMAPYVDGYYLITPFGRTPLAARIMAEIRKNADFEERT